MAKLVFFVGPAGAGKTTVAKALAKRRGATLLDMDTMLRPAAAIVMRTAGLDPEDRDSADYKRLCRDLGYRMTMDVALENAALGGDVYAIGPFTKETADPDWLSGELAALEAHGAATAVKVKVVFVFLRSEELYRTRIRERDLRSDDWKLANWPAFSASLPIRPIAWPLPTGSVYYCDNSEPLTEEKLVFLERFLDG